MIVPAKNAKPFRAVDLFCGGGGSTTGAQNAGCKVVYALNHDPISIDTHSANNPDVKHRCAPIDRVDPWRDVPACDLLMASPECTHHSIARGGRPVEEQRRATGWDVVRWIEALRPKWVVVENVREFLDWGPIGKNGRPLKSKKGEIFKAWLTSIEALGYHVEHKLLNAADYGAHTKRIRFFAIARRGNSRQPIPWPEPTHAKKDWRPAYEIIDWAKPCPSIFTRKRPLAEKTLRRIEVGLRKFVEPFVVKFRGNEFGESIAEPVSTITAGGRHHGLAIPFLVKYHGGTNPQRDGTERQHGLDEPMPTLDTQPRFALAAPFLYTLIGRGAGRSKSVTEPLPTIVAARENHGIAIPFLSPNFGERDGQEPRTHDVQMPLPTVTGHGAGTVVTPFLLPREGFYKQNGPRSVDEPLHTIIANNHSGHVVLPFLTKYFGTGGATEVEQPLDTVTTRDRFGLAAVDTGQSSLFEDQELPVVYRPLLETMAELGVGDIGFRMLGNDELARAQGFPEDYYWHGNKAQQTKQIGNAVPPPLMEAICSELSDH